MTCQPACISADTLHPVLTAMRQPPRLRAMSPFARLFDETALTVTRFSPPLPIRPLTPAALDRNAPGGGQTVVPTAGQTTPALIPTTMDTRAHFLRATRFAREPIAAWTPLATVLSHLQRRDSLFLCQSSNGSAGKSI